MVSYRVCVVRADRLGISTAINGTSTGFSLATARAAFVNGTQNTLNKSSATSDDLLRRIVLFFGYVASVLLLLFSLVDPSLNKRLHQYAQSENTSGKATRWAKETDEVLSDAAEWARGGSDAGIRRRVGSAIDKVSGFVGQSEQHSNGH